MNARALPDRQKGPEATPSHAHHGPMAAHTPVRCAILLQASSGASHHMPSRASATACQGTGVQGGVGPWGSIRAPPSPGLVACPWARMSCARPPARPPPPSLSCACEATE